jgi:hypothetical protein
LLLGNADAYALDALASSGQLLRADVVEVALPPDTGINLDQPLGVVLRMAEPHLVLVDRAPSPPGRHTQGQAPGVIWPPDAPTSLSLGATILRMSGADSITIRQDAQGVWRYR